MAGEGKGWISVYRKIENSWLWEDRPFARGQAWIDLLLQANYKDKKTFSKGELVEVKRGSFLTSDKELADRWGWSRNKVRGFLDVLVEEHMVTLERTTKGTSLTIENYSFYQNQGTTESTTEGTTETKGNMKIGVQEGTTEGISSTADSQGFCHGEGTTESTTEKQRKVQQKDTNNNINNINNGNKNSSSPAAKSYIEFFNNNFHLISSYEAEILNSFAEDGLDEEVILLGLKKAVENNVRNINYVKRILQDWLDKGIKTVAAVEAEQREFKRAKESKQVHKQEYKPNARIPGASSNQRKYDGDELEKMLLGRNEF